MEQTESAVRLISIAAIVADPERKPAFMDMMRDFASDILKEVVGFAQRVPIHLTLAPDRNAPAIPYADACLPDPPHRSPRQAQAQLA
jgi:hypothetical protein